MYYPSLEQFCELAEKHALVPVYQEILADVDTPVSAFLKACDGKYSFLLESIEGGEKWARFSFLGTNPQVVIAGKGDKVEVTKSARVETITTEDPLGVVRDVMSKYKPAEVAGLPRFFGGAVGFLGYDMVRQFEKLPSKQKKASPNFPDFVFMITDTIIIFDNVTHKIKVVSNAHIGNQHPRASYGAATMKISEIIAKLRGPIKKSRRRIAPKNIKPESNMTKQDFEKMVAKSKKYIKAGDIFQVVLSQRFSTAISAPPFDIYRALRLINPSPYMVYMSFDDLHIISSSPEVMVRCEEEKLCLRPIAGTRPRGANDVEDERLVSELTKDPKERAEHIMLVDLGRNDLGRVAKSATVKADKLFTIEKYSHVMHMVSDVVGDLKDGKDTYDVIKACFPAGTVSGAPKVRAMEIIEELEPTPRGLYAGAAGYISFSGNLDTCINIRTVIVKGKTAYLQAGAGIVADSDPEREYFETVNKAKALQVAIEMAERGLE